ncbi:unnamed protein product, partial [Didymodactylos carnosus]
KELIELSENLLSQPSEISQEIIEKIEFSKIQLKLNEAVINDEQIFIEIVHEKKDDQSLPPTSLTPPCELVDLTSLIEQQDED